MDDPKDNDTNNIGTPDNEELYEDIQHVSFEKNELNQAIVTAANAYFGFLSGLIESVHEHNKDKSRRDKERQKHQDRLDKLAKEAKVDEEENWKAIKRVKTHTTVLVYIYNGTDETFALESSTWDNSIHPKEAYDIAPWQFESFRLSSETPARRTRRSNLPTQVKHGFSYKGGGLAFDFSTLLKLVVPYNPWTFEPQVTLSRSHDIRSIGNTPLNCKSSITRSLDGAPYSYNVVIILG